MRKKKAFYLVFATLLMVGSILTACSPNANTNKGNNGNTNTGGSASGSFSYLMHDKFINWLKEDKWYPYVEEATSTTVEFVPGGSNDDEYYASVDQKIISRTFPDSGIVSISQATVYGAQGAFVDLAPYIEEFGPNIKAYIEANPTYKTLITNEDGQIFGLVSEAPRFADFIFYRADHFNKAGITTVPQTIDELTDAMRKLKAHYGATDKNYYPMVGREGYIRFQSAFNAAANYDDGVSRGIYGNGKTGTDLYSEGYKHMVEWYKTLYDEGLIDPEWVAGSGTEESWESKMLTGQGTLSYDYLTRPSWFLDNGGPENDPDYTIAILPYLKDLNGNPSVQNTETQYNILRAMVVNADSEDKAETIIKFLDYLYSEEGQTLVSWGVEGESYKEERGEKQYIVDFSEQEATPAGEPRWSFLNDRLTFAKPMDNDAFYSWNTELVRKAAHELFTDENLKTGVQVTYTADQAKKLADLSSKVNEAVNAGVTQFVTGKRAMTEWDAFLGEMEAAGYKDIVAIQQEAYDAMYK
ncbi:type 2 periplasmic-binding domain-containing protein [Paenibacillus senegalimassiliensis]|uniref:extracellular solute-binding protein n=1 Tax=Paenibacillus senegalimassiliensis TaxID=1737426 RepID=UPI00073F53EE|nr:extracellular solute-binding protein [Paenibacillus senegalimassiliensis]